MAINLGKNLVVGERINLTKKTEQGLEKSVSRVYAGANWSSLSNGSPVDLDLTAVVYDESKNHVETVCFSCLASKDRSITHSGDDRSGDAKGSNDGLDNEIISVDLTKLDPKNKLMFIMNSYSGHEFSNVPNIELRIYTNDTHSRDLGENTTILASFKLDNKEFKGKKAIVLGYFYNRNGMWKFATVGQTTAETSIPQIINGSAKDAIQ